MNTHKVTNVEYEPFIKGSLVGYKCKIEGIATIDNQEVETYTESFVYLNPSHFDPSDQENTPNIFVYQGVTDKLDEGDPLIYVEPFTH